MPNQRQASFVSGEISPALRARVDLERYTSSLARCRNFIVARQGGAYSRPGTRFCGAQKNDGLRVRFIPFVFADGDAYILEFGNLYVRFVRNGEYVLTGAAIYEVATPYTTAQLGRLRYAQLGDVMTLTHSAHEIQELRRFDHAVWTLTPLDVTPTILPPTGLAVVTDPDFGADESHPAKPWSWVVTAENINGEESVGSAALTPPESAVVYPDRPAVVLSFNASAGAVKYHLYRGMNALFGYVGTTVSGDDVAFDPWRVGSQVTLTANLDVWAPEDVGKHMYLGYTEVGVVTRGVSVFIDARTSAQAIEATIMQAVSTPLLNPTQLSGIPAAIQNEATDRWSFVSGSYPDQIAEVLIVPGVEPVDDPLIYFKDDARSPAYTDTPPQAANPIGAAGDYPAAVAYFEQRRVFARTDNHRQRVITSMTGQYSRFDTREPPLEDDAITLDLAADSFDEIRALVAMGRLIVLTASSAWTLSGAGSGALTPTSVEARPQDRVGVSWVNPIVVGGVVMFVHVTGAAIQDLHFDFNSDAWRSDDLSVLAQHLFAGHTITALAFARVPWSVVWVVRSDGKLLGMTWDKAQNVWAWHMHETDGDVEDVCSIPEGTEDAVYLSVKRTVGGATKRYVERLASRNWTNILDARCLDSHEVYDGRGDGVVTVTPSAGDDLAEGETVTLTRSTDWPAGLVGQRIVLGPAGAARVLPASTDVVVDVTAVVGSTLTGTLRDALLTARRGVATTNWAIAYNTFSGLDHLSGAITVVADGSVHRNVVVAAGAFTLPVWAEVVVAGLAFESVLETLPLWDPRLDGRKRIPNALLVQVEGTRGLEAGETEASMVPWKQRLPAEGYGVMPLVTVEDEITVRAKWGRAGSIVLRQSEPLPCAVLAVTPEFQVGA